MTAPFASAHVRAELDWNNLDEELKKRVAEAADAAEKTLKEKLDKWSLSVAVKLKPSIGEFRKLAREKLDGITLVKDVGLRTTNAHVNTWATALKEKLAKKTFTVNVTPKLNMTSLNTSLANLPEATLKVKLTVLVAEQNRFSQWLRTWLATQNFTAAVNLNVANATQFRALIDQLTRDRTVNVRTRNTGGTGNLARAATPNLPNLAVLAGGASAVAAALAAIGGAAGVAVGAVGVLAGGLAALGPAAVAGISTALVALNGIGSAFSALSAADESAGADAAAQASATASATKQVTAAERELRDANKDSKTATEDVTRARKDATKQLRDYAIEQRGGVLSEKEAQLDLADARKDLANLKPGDDRERAALRVAQAEQRLMETTVRNRDLAEEKADADAKGVEGSDLVTSAQDRLAAAQERVADAETARLDAVTALNDAMTKGSSAQDKAAQALAKLSPNAREFVLAMRDLKPMTEGLGDAVQDAGFADLGERFTGLAKATLPAVQEGMVGVAGSMNGAAKQFAAFWSTAGAQQGIKDAFAGTASLIDGLQPGLAQASQGFLSMASAAKPAMEGVGQALGGLAGSIGQVFTDAANSGALTQLVESFSSVIGGLSGGLGPLLDGLVQAGNIIAPALGPLLTALGTALGDIAPSLAELGAVFADTLTQLLPQLTPFIKALADGLGPVLPVLGQLLGAMATALTPLIGPLSQVAQVIGTALADALVALAPAMGPLGQAFASLITAFAPIIPVIAEVVSGLIQALAPALTTIFTALAPVITQIADLMMPIFEQLAPILADVAMQIGTAIADALTTLMPYLPGIIASFSQLVMAIAPLLPQLIEMGLSLLPPLIDLFIAILPQVQGFIDVLTWLVNNVIMPLVIPAIQLFADHFGSAIENAATAITTVRDKIGGAVSAIAGFFTGLGSSVSSVWTDTIVPTIKSAVREIGKFLMELPEIKIPDLPGVPGRGTTIGFAGVGQSMVDWAGAEGKAGGGRLIRGPGTGTSDSIPAILDGIKPLRVANGEFLSTADAYDRAGPVLEAINAGWTPSADFLAAMWNRSPGFAGGGLVSADELVKFARGVEGAEYDWGGVNWGDCSGAVSALANKATGRDPFASRFGTGTMESALSSMGAIPGIGPKGSLNIGWFNGGPYGGHTAATLPNGVNFEMGGARGDGQYGGKAAGANDPSFTDHAHFPPEFFLGGDPGNVGGASKGGRSSKLGGGGSGGGGGKSRSSAGGSTGGNGGSSSGGGDTSSDTSTSVESDSGPVLVEVANWPSDIGSASTAAAQAAVESSPTLSAPAPAATSSITGLPYTPGTGPGLDGGAPATGIGAANAWLAQQDMAGQLKDWSIAAVKEIVAPAVDPFGITGLVNTGIDQAAAAITAPVNITQNFYGNYDAQKVATDTDRALTNRMTPVSQTYRMG